MPFVVSATATSGRRSPLKSANAIPIARPPTANGESGAGVNVPSSFCTQRSNDGRLSLVATMSGWPSPVKSATATVSLWPVEGRCTGVS